MKKVVKIVVFVPVSHADLVRKAIGDAGAGEIGNYSHCTFSTKGISRFLPKNGANPTIGNVGKFEEVEEEKIETICEESKLKQVIGSIQNVHPYEEAPIDVYPIMLLKEF